MFHIIRKVLTSALMLASGYVTLYSQTATTDSTLINGKEAAGSYHPAALYPSDATDLSDRSSTDIATPDNIKTEVTYDPQSGNYKYETKVGDESLGVPFYLQSNEYADYMAQQSLKEYYKQKNAEAQKTKHQITLTDMKFDIGPADRVFGPGGVQLKLQGSAELDFGLNFKKLKDPSLSERSQNPAPTFDFDEKIQLSVDGSVGDKLKFGLNYNTEATFDYDQSLIKLQYEGKEDDIIKKIEAGNVSMPLSGSLITGNTSLFGIRADLQFGKLSINAVVSQQESDGKTVNTSGAQTTKYEVRADSYDENRHFFLTHFFRDHYDEWVKDLPNVSSGVLIGEIEVWVTNKNSVNYNNVTNVVGFVDLGEPVTIYNPTFHPATGAVAPDNDANDLYQRVVRDNGGLPDIYTVDSHLMPFNMSSGVDYSKIEGARKLETTEYTLNNTLGFISLKTALNNDEVLCVAFQYTYKGKVYTVGELSKGVAGDKTGTQGDQARPLALKMLRTTESSPELPTWKLMMKNIYSLGAYQVQQDKFRLNIMFRNDSTGIDLRYIDEGPIARTPLIRVMNLDNLDIHNQKVKNGDGVFDFVDGYTILPSSGKIIFPVLEPFGSYLADKLGNDPALVRKYCFQELYDSTLVVAQELAEKNKFYLTGEYRASSGSEIRLNAMNIPKGSVKVTAGGRELVENVDYTVDYMMGVVNILNQDIIELGTPVSVTLESQSLFNTTRKSLIGTHLNYAFNDHFNVGGTFMLLTEKPLTEKSSFGNDPVSNIMWGLNASYRNQFQSITDFFNKIPILNLKQPSTLAINAEFAQMVPGTAPGANGKIYVDDFESTKIGFDVRYAYNWRLASTPSRFEESKLSNNVEYGKNRAHIAWYYIDNMFNRSTATTPSYLTRDKEQLSNHFVREIAEQEIFPNKELVYGQSSYIQTLDISYYPSERGQYNINASSLGSDGRMKNQKDAWGGIMRKLETTDFETNNIEYLEFWLMDPFVYNDNGQMKGGDLYFNLGNISEDILKDGYKSYENGLPVDGSATNIVETVWGKVSTKQSINYAFETSSDARKYQDVGLNGLSTEEEKGYGAYKKFVDEYSSNLDPAIADSVRNDKFSPLNDPAGDNFHHYRGDDYDAAQTSILDRYKHYNGTEGNSPVQSGTSYTTAATNNPDVEDINQDNTMTDTEKYFEYRVSLRPGDMVVGENFITDKVTSSVTLKNGKQASVNWYQFKIPITDSEKYKSVNGMKSFKSIRFMRMYLTGFEEETHLRFATMELVKGEWRTYNQVIDERYYDPSGMLESTSVSIEDNASKRPVNYVLPPGVKREVDPSQQQVRQENEQSMALLLHNLHPKDSRAVYKRLGGYDMNLYGRMQMFVHAEAFEEDSHLDDQDLSLFVRIGTDYKNNYYEYEVPLNLTPPGNYSNNNTGDRATVWPENNMIDFPLSILTNLKKQRNREKGTTGTSVSNMTEYSGVDPEKPNNRISVKGNPNLADVEVVMIGIRNNSRLYQSAEIWVDELLLTDIDQSGGVAALANVDFSIADFISLSAAGRVETMGFGQIEQTIAERRQEDYYQYNVNAGIDLGKLIPEKVNAVIPIKVSYSNEIQNPKYNPLDKDILLKDALAMEPDRKMRDSILRIAQTVYTNTSLSIPNIRFGYTGKNGPRPWDPACFTIGGAFSQTESRDPNTVRNINQHCNAYGQYEFSWTPTPWEPFGKISKLKNDKNWKWIADIGINYAPKRFAYKTDFTRDYYEQQVRDYGGNFTALDPTFQKDFMWNNSFDIAWDITKNIRLTLTTNNASRISENEGGVNKYLYPDEYEVWKDSVRSSLAHLGTPMDYNQRFTATYAIPFNKINFLNWLSGNLKYDGTYVWAYGNEVIANTASSKGTWGVDGRVNFETLYNKSSWAKEVNRKYNSRATTSNKTQKARNYKQKIQLKKGEKVVIRHRLNSTRLIVFGSIDGKTPEKIKFKTIDNNTIQYKAKQDGEMDIDITTDVSENTALEVTARVGMMIRNVSFNYSQSDGTVLPGFKPSVKFLGLDTFNGSALNAPGFDFVMGIQNSNMLQRALDNKWLVTNGSVYSAAQMTHSESFKLSALIEPFAGFKINIAADRQFVTSTETQFQIDTYTATDGALVTTIGGNLSQSYVAIGTSFASMSKSGALNSDLFSQFLANRDVIQDRLNATYNPKAGSSYKRNSDDVLIPAFLAAYGGRDVNSVSLSLIPKFWTFLPNWQVTFDGLNRIPWVKEHFRSINLTHAYNCKYQIGSFTSDQSFRAVNGNDFGYVKDVTTGNDMATSAYTINSVTISEQFSPLIGVDINLKNSLSAKFEWRKGRTLGMNLASNQIVESWNDEYVVGLGYKFADLSFTMKQKNRQKKVKNDLNLRADFSLKDVETIIRKIELEQSQATAGDFVVAFKFSADYVFSERLSFRLYYDMQLRNPVVSTSYPTSNYNVGVAVKVLLTR